MDYHTVVCKQLCVIYYYIYFYRIFLVHRKQSCELRVKFNISKTNTIKDVARVSFYEQKYRFLREMTIGNKSSRCIKKNKNVHFTCVRNYFTNYIRYI